MIALIISILLGYLLGSIPTGFIFGKIFGKLDIRQLGSGNVGATNVYRMAGKLPGVLTLLIDITKGVVATGVFATYFYKWGVPLRFEYYQISMALAVISGHNWTPFLKFKGGKGIATSAGALMILCPRILLIVSIVWIASFVLTKIVSVSSIISSIALPIVSAFYGNFALTIFSIILCLISIFKHKSNIVRLIRGEEKRLKI